MGALPLARVAARLLRLNAARIRHATYLRAADVHDD
jgi:hypothetical protein